MLKRKLKSLLSKKLKWIYNCFVHFCEFTDGLISSSSSATIDFEALSEHTIVMSVTVSDGNAQDVKELYINVTNENEPPEFQQDTYSISGDEGEVSVCIVSIVFEYIFMLQNKISTTMYFPGRNDDW